MNLSNSEIAQIKSVTDELTPLLAAYDATEHPREKTAIADQIIECLRGNASAFNLAHEILDEKIEAAIAEFVSSTRHFYNDAISARRAAESTDLVRSVNHERNELSGESLESARNIQAIFLTVTKSQESKAAENTK